MSERKNIKRNSTRVKASQRPFHQSIQRNYNKPKSVDTAQMKLI